MARTISIKRLCTIYKNEALIEEIERSNRSSKKTPREMLIISPIPNDKGA